MKNFILYLLAFLIISIMCALGFKACDYEAQQNESKNLQWVEDANNGNPYTNFQE